MTYLKNIIFIAALMSFLFSFTSCDKRLRKEGNGELTSTVRSLPAFSAIEADGKFTIYTHRSTEPRIEITTDNNLINDIRTFVQENRLYIEMSDDYYLYDFTSLEIHIYGPDYQALDLDGDISFYATDTLTVPSFLLEHDGEGFCALLLQGNELTLELDGRTTCRLGGQCQNLRADIDGKGTLEALAFTANKAYIEIDGSGAARLDVVQELHATINGAGEVRYTGAPQVYGTINGSGNISPY